MPRRDRITGALMTTGTGTTETGSVRLTALSHGAGCACKLPLAALEELMAGVGPGLGGAHGDLLIGAVAGDDAAVYRLDERRALVLTTDFFTPIVDDARDWGRIAAANALSDVYAMGGRPLLALNLTAWPAATLPIELLAEVLRGGAEVAREAGCLVVGGHSVDDPEPKYGMAVVGLADPGRLRGGPGRRRARGDRRDRLRAPRPPAPHAARERRGRRGGRGPRAVPARRRRAGQCRVRLRRDQERPGVPGRQGGARPGHPPGGRHPA